MTTLAQRLAETPMAPYAGLLRDMTREQKEVVVAFIIDTMEDKDATNASEFIRNKYKNLQESPSTKWFREHANKQAWNKQDAWSQLSDKQREEVSSKLHLTADDMNERTFALIEKHLK